MLASATRPAALGAARNAPFTTSGHSQFRLRIRPHGAVEPASVGCERPRGLSLGALLFRRETRASMTADFQQVVALVRPLGLLMFLQFVTLVVIAVLLALIYGLLAKRK